AHRDAGDLRRDAGQGQAGVVRLPRDQRVLLPDVERCSGRLRRGRERRHHPDLDRWRGVPLRPDGEEHGRGLAGLRRLRRRGGQELPRQRRPAHRPLPPGQARRVRASVDRSVDRAGEERPGPAVPVAHVGRLRRTSRREPADRGRAARAVRAGEDHPGDRGRRGRRRGGRHRRRDRRQALHHPRGRAGHRGGARARRQGALHDRADLRERARRLQARQREAPSGDPRAGAAGDRREVRLRRRLRPRHPSAGPGLPRRLGVDRGGDRRGGRLRRGEDERRHRHPVRLHPAGRRAHVQQLRGRPEGRRRGRQQEAVRPTRLGQGRRGGDGRSRGRGVREPPQHGTQAV
ncbi:MAG: Fructose-bisphosphate aldolase class II, partial [uncultured Nocardioidaceae bacterium]